tara:strand:- start:3888 stop:4031 length:144 start_codon:yes stop_codon:yes gene_type:complete
MMDWRAHKFGLEKYKLLSARRIKGRNININNDFIFLLSKGLKKQLVI